jgi:flavodoxin
MKKILILYDTVYGNTKKVAMALSRGLEAGNCYVDCISIQEVDILEINNYDVIGIGSPTHFQGVPKSMKLYLKKIKSLNMKKKQGFAFETKREFPLAGSAAKKIMRVLKSLNFTIIHPAITSIVVDKEGPLQDKSLDKIEQIGLRISDNITINSTNHNKYQGNKRVKNSSVNNILHYLIWILIGGGPIFFFIRAIYLACTGGDCFGTINPLCSWLLLALEIVTSGFTGATGIMSILLIKTGKSQLIMLEKISLKKIIFLTGIISYAVHFTRVAIWIVFCVI